MKVSDYIGAALARKGVKAVFELSGGMITHLLDSIYLQGGVRMVSMHHEQGAAFAADATGRITGVPGVAMATSGPGATNLLTGMGSCYFDSSPAVFITGQVNRNEQKGDRAIRQLGFQETDIVSMVGAITKKAWRVREVEDVPGILDQAFVTAMEGRPGPVLVDIPMDVQRGDLQVGEAAVLRHEPEARPMDAELGALREQLRKAKRPLILAGGGVRSGRAIAQFRAWPWRPAVRGRPIC